MLPHSRAGPAARAVNLDAGKFLAAFDDRPDPAAGGCALESPALVGFFPQTAKLKTIAARRRGQGGTKLPHLLAKPRSKAT